MGEKSQFGKIIQTGALLLFLIGLPFGSWYYLKAGFDYNKGIMGELKEYGKLPDVNLITQNQDTLQIEDFRGKIIVADFFGEQSESKEKILKYLQDLWKQFHDQPDLVFLSHSLEPGQSTATARQAMAKKYQLNASQIYFLSTQSKAEMIDLLGKGYQMPTDQKDAEGNILLESQSSFLPKDYPYFVLIDTSLTIRNYYQVNDHQSVSRMVEHLALILPRKEKGRATVQRLKEK